MVTNNLSNVSPLPVENVYGNAKEEFVPGSLNYTHGVA
jgi:hypothetical protein